MSVKAIDMPQPKSAPSSLHKTVVMRLYLINLI